MLKTLSLLSIGFLCGVVFHFLVGAFARIRRLRQAALATQQHLKRIAEKQAADEWASRVSRAQKGLL